MPAQVAVLASKVLLDQANLTWKSEPMNWTGFKRAEMYLESHGQANGSSVSLSFEGSSEDGVNAVWTTIAAPTGYADPSALTAIGVNRYVRTELYPFVRVVVSLSSGAGMRAAVVSVGGTLLEQA